MMTRRELVGGMALAAAGCAVPKAAQPEATFAGWQKGHFQIHFIYTGVGESMFLIFPDGTTMLLDCGDFAAIERGSLALPVMPDPSKHAGEWIARYVKRVNPQGDDVDYMLVSHFHRDHTGTVKWYEDVVTRGGRDYYLSGFSLAAEQLHIRRALDRTGGVFDGSELFRLTENNIPYLLGCTYGYLKARDGLVVEKFREGAVDQIRPLRGETKDFHVKNICANGRFALADGSVLDTLHPGGQTAFDWNENHLSCGSVFSYGKFRFFTAGDVSGPAISARGDLYYPEADLGRALTGPVSVAKVNHHGFKSMPNEMVRALQAKVYTLCTWDFLHSTDESLFWMCLPSNQKGERLIVPGYFPQGRCTSRNAPFRRNFPAACYEGVHTVVDVPPGGETFRLTLLDARDEEMRIVEERVLDS